MLDLPGNIPPARDKQPLRAVDSRDTRHALLMQRADRMDPAHDSTDLLFTQIFSPVLALPDGDIHSIKNIRREAGNLRRAIEELSMVELSKGEVGRVRGYLHAYLMKIAVLEQGRGGPNAPRQPIPEVTRQFIHVTHQACADIDIQLTNIADESRRAIRRHKRGADRESHPNAPKTKRGIDIASGILSRSIQELKAIEIPGIEPRGPRPGGVFSRARRAGQGGSSFDIAS